MKYLNALPVTFRELFKQHNNVTAGGIGSNAVTSIDYFALPSEKEVFGTTKYANSVAEADNAQFEYYKTSVNRLKKYGNNGTSEHYWWLRSPSSREGMFCMAYYTGESSDTLNCAGKNGISTFGVI